MRIALVLFGIDLTRPRIVAHRMENLPSRLERAAAAEKCLMEMGVDVIHDMGTGWSSTFFIRMVGLE